MKPKTLKALKESIAHWQRLANGKAKRGEGIGADNCALCDLFIYQHCVGCPVRDKTRQSICRGSPYHAASRACNNYGKTSPQFKAAARKELKFLQSLLPKKRKSKPSHSSSSTPAATKAP